MLEVANWNGFLLFLSIECIELEPANNQLISASKIINKNLNKPDLGLDVDYETIPDWEKEYENRKNVKNQNCEKYIHDGTYSHNLDQMVSEGSFPVYFRFYSIFRNESIGIKNGR